MYSTMLFLVGKLALKASWFLLKMGVCLGTGVLMIAV